MFYVNRGSAVKAGQQKKQMNSGMSHPWPRSCRDQQSLLMSRWIFRAISGLPRSVSTFRQVRVSGVACPGSDRPQSLASDNVDHCKVDSLT